METTLDFLEGFAGWILLAIIGVITVIAVIRSAIKVKKGKKLDIPPVGVYNDLPSSVTGLNKYKDRHE